MDNLSSNARGHDNEFDGFPWDAAPFPSNSLSLGQLRRLTRDDSDAIGTAVHNLTRLETEVALDAYAISARTSPERTSLRKESLEQNVRELSSLYVQIGLAAGRHEARQLVEYLTSWSAAMGDHKGQAK